MLKLKSGLAAVSAFMLWSAGTAPVAQSVHPKAAGIRAVPVRTATLTVGNTITVCMYGGARPSPYRVITATCRGGADFCTAWIELGEEEAEMVVTIYNLDFAPVEATGPVCDQPRPPASGAIPPRSE